MKENSERKYNSFIKKTLAESLAVNKWKNPKQKEKEKFLKYFVHTLKML